MRSKAAMRLGVVGLGAIDADALVVTREMRRGEAPAALARGAQHRIETGDGGALAVGAADGDHAVVGREQIRDAAPPRARALKVEVDGAGV